MNDCQNYCLCICMGFLMLGEVILGNFLGYPYEIRNLFEFAWSLSGRSSCFELYILKAMDAMYVVEAVRFWSVCSVNWW